MYPNGIANQCPGLCAALPRVEYPLQPYPEGVASDGAGCGKRKTSAHALTQPRWGRMQCYAR